MSRPNQLTVWDPLVRVLHWGLATAFLTAYFTSEGNRQVHMIAGLAVVAIVTVRALWGLVGSPHARFDDFVRPPAEILSYLRDLLLGRARRHLGHNPAGAAMIVSLLTALVATALSAILMVRGIGDRELMEEMHELLGNVTLALAVVHVLGVLVSSRLHRENLVWAMVTGRKPAPPAPAGDLGAAR